MLIKSIFFLYLLFSSLLIYSSFHFYLFINIIIQKSDELECHVLNYTYTNHVISSFFFFKLYYFINIFKKVLVGKKSCFCRVR